MNLPEPTLRNWILWGLIVLTLLFFIGFLLSVPSIDKYCQEGKKTWFGINIWKNENCIKYWKLQKEILSDTEKKYNTTIIFKDLNKQQIENIINTTGGACALFSIKNRIIILTNRTNCTSINESINHELKHLKCFRMGYRWHNDSEAHEGCFLNVTL